MAFTKMFYSITLNVLMFEALINSIKLNFKKSLIRVVQEYF